MPIQHVSQSTNLLEVLEKILDKGVVIAGDIKIAIADVDLLTIKIRLLVASVDKAKEIGMDWWESDPYYSSKGRLAEKERTQLLERIDRLEQLVETKAIPHEVDDHVLIGPISEKGIHSTDEKVIPQIPDEPEEESNKANSTKNEKEKDLQSKKSDKKKPGKH